MRLATIALCLAAYVSSVGAASMVNRRVSDVLNELRSEGFVFIYSTSVIPADLRVRSEPQSRSGLERAREVLAQHGLSLMEAAPQVYAVVRRSERREQLAVEPPPATEPIERVVVQTSRYVLNNDFGAATFLSQDQIEELPQLADETLRAVQRVPGSATNGFSSVGPIRGGEPGEVAIILDGLRLYEPFHLRNFLSPVSLLDARLIEGLEYYSGGFPAIYGDRMSAIIDARTIHPGQPRYFELGLNLFHFSALASMGVDDDRGHVLLSYRRSNLGDLVQFSEKDFGEPNYQDAFGRIDYRLNDQTQAAFQFLLSGDAITAKRESEQQTSRARYQNVYAWGTIDHRWSDAAASRAIASYTTLEDERRGRIDEPQRVAAVIDDRIFHVLGLRFENSLDAGALRHRFGLEGRRLWGSYNYASEVRWQAGAPFPGSPPARIQRRSTPKPEGYETLGYWDVRVSLDHRLMVQGGLRVDTQTYDGSDDGEQWSPRLSALYELTPRTQLRGSWGRFYQAQGINELQVEDGVDHFHPAQFADQFILGVDHAFDAGLDLRIEAYRKRYRRLNPRFENMFDPLAMFPEAEYDRVMIDPDSARAYGVETLLRLRQRGSWQGWLSYSWSQVEDRVEGVDTPRSWDQQHAVTLGVVWSNGPWTASLANSYHSGWPTTLLRVDASSGTPVAATDARNRARLGAFNSLDVRLSRVFALSRGVLDVFVEVTNATSRENPCCVEYTVDTDSTGQTTYRTDTDTWLPLVPNAGFLWRY